MHENHGIFGNSHVRVKLMWMISIASWVRLYVSYNLTVRWFFSAVVAEKPRIVESPKDIIAKENTNVIFYCRATGDPEPTVIWKKLDGQIAADRYQKSLCLSVQYGG